MELPPLAPVPPARVWKSLMPQEWELCLDSWLLLIEKYLLLPPKIFTVIISKGLAVVPFLVSYVKNPITSTDAKSSQLRKKCFILMHRSIKEVKPPPIPLLEWDFLSNLCLQYPKSGASSVLLGDTWDQILESTSSIHDSKISLTKDLEYKASESEVEDRLLLSLGLIRSCHKYGQFLMVGSDLIDALSIAYDKAQANLQKKIVTVVYYSLMSLMTPDAKTSILLDHLYSLKTSALLKALIGGTPFLQKMRTQISGLEIGRARSLIESLAVYEKTPSGRPRRPIRRKVEKGKGRAVDEYGHGAKENIQVHKLSLVSQIQDLFPDLGSAFIIKLLDEYDDDTALVTDHLLNDDLPPYLKQADRAEEIDNTRDYQDHDLVPDLAPRSTPPLLPVRRNIHDDDDFDRLAIDTSKLHLGKKTNPTADDLLVSERTTSQKAAILSALAAFDSDDDERDDTYDVEDVGGTVDNTNDDNAADLRQEMHEEALLNAYNMSPELFNRDADTRRGKYRAALKSETGMTDEAIEGWAIMMGRDPRKLKRLEAKYEIAGGKQQNVLQGTAWKGDSGTEGTEDSDAGGGSKGDRTGDTRGRGRGRGRGQGRGGGVGGVAGDTGDKGTQVARQRKDANKGSRANHNRRDQRARKMAKGGFPG